MPPVMPPRPDKPLEDREYPDETDLNDPGASFLSCPFCNGLIYDESPQCPHCNQWLTHRLSDWRQSDKWYIRGGLWAARTILHTWLLWLAIGLIGLLLWLLRGGLQ